MSVRTQTRDNYVISRSFRFIAPTVSDVDTIFNRVDYDLETSYFSTAVGDNKYINPLPGFGHNTDPSPALAVKGGGIINKLGSMGRYYKRIYDDNAVLLTITAGAPEFTGILRFITNSFDYASSLITNKGRSPSYIFYITQAISSIAYLPMQLLGTGMNFLAYLFEEPKNQWYYVKPTMGLYLAAAQGIFNDLMVGAGFALTVFNDTKSFQGNVTYGSAEYNTGTLSGFNATDAYSAKEDNLQYMNQLFPDAINKDGTVDIVKIIGRGARKYRYFLMAVKNLDKRIGNRTITTQEKDRLIEKTLEDLLADPNFLNGDMGGVGNKGTADYLKAEYDLVGKQRSADEVVQPEIASSYYDSVPAQQVRPVGEDGTTELYSQGTDTLVDQLKGRNQGLPGNNYVNATGDFSGNQLEPDNQYNSVDVNTTISQDGWFSEVFNLLKDTFLGGMDAVTFRVEGSTGPITDSFSNQTKPNELASFFNGTVSAINDFKFNTQGGTTGIGIVDTVLDRIKQGAAGLASGTVIGNIPLALLGNSRVTIPENWSDSTTNLHSESYEIYCEAMYGEPYTIATQILLPLSLIVPFFAPVATGGSSYTSPFMCKVFSQGRTIIKTGMVRNASITFGEGDLGWTKSRLPLNMRIRLEFADLDPILSIPITRLKNPLEVFNIAGTSAKYLGEVGKYNEWITRVTGQEWLNTILKFNKLNQHVTRFKNDLEYMFSPSNIAGAVNDSIVGDVSRIFVGTNLRR